jgi:hypothetical protein
MSVRGTRSAREPSFGRPLSSASISRSSGREQRSRTSKDPPPCNAVLWRGGQLQIRGRANRVRCVGLALMPYCRYYAIVRTAHHARWIQSAWYLPTSRRRGWTRNVTVTSALRHNRSQPATANRASGSDSRLTQARPAAPPLRLVGSGDLHCHAACCDGEHLDVQVVGGAPPPMVNPGVLVGQCGDLGLEPHRDDVLALPWHR